MAQFITKKSVQANYPCLSVGYCAVQNLFPQSIRREYWSGIYGWNCDIHYINLDKPINGNYTIALTTGYRPFGKTVDYKLAEKYDKLAQHFKEKYRELFSVGDRHRVLWYLRKRFIREALSK